MVSVIPVPTVPAMAAVPAVRHLVTGVGLVTTMFGMFGMPGITGVWVVVMDGVVAVQGIGVNSAVPIVGFAWVSGVAAFCVVHGLRLRRIIPP